MIFALLAPTENALQYMLLSLFLKNNVEKSYNIVFKHKSKNISTALTLQCLPIEQVSECVYLGVVLMENLSCTSDVKRSKRTFFNNLIQ